MECFQDLLKTIEDAEGLVKAKLTYDFNKKNISLQTQISTLTNNLPTIKMHAGLCATFMNTADKYQFLEMAYPMLDRLSQVAQLGHLPQLSLSDCNLKSDYGIEINHALWSFLKKYQSYDYSSTSNQDTYNYETSGEKEVETGKVILNFYSLSCQIIVYYALLTHNFVRYFSY